MEKFTRLLTGRAQQLQQNLESLLDLDQWTPPQPKKTFEVKTNLSELQNLNIQKKQTDELVVSLLCQLSPYFESGLLLFRKSTANKKEVWVHGAGFLEGSSVHLPEESAHKSLELPALQKLELKKCSPYLLLNPLDLTDLCDHSDSTAFMIKVHDLFAFVLMSKLPEPWLRMHIEKIHAFIRFTLHNNHL